MKIFVSLVCALFLCPFQLLLAANPPKKAAAPGKAIAAPKAGVASKPDAARKDDAVPKNDAEKTAGPAPATTATEIPEVVATVEGTEIKKGEVDKVLASVLGQSGRSPADLPPEQKSGAYRMILDDMIAEKLINRRAADVKITDEDVDATFKRATANMGSEQEVRLQIEQNGETVATVKENIRSSLRQQQWVDAQLKGKLEVSDAEADDFFKQHPEQFKVPERVRASHILLAVKQDAPPETVARRQKEVEAISARVKKGEDFSKLAKELSEDPSAKENSGDLNFFAREQMVPEFADAAFKLGKDEVSDPVRTQFGFHLIKVTDRNPAGNMSLEQAKPRLIAFLKQQKKQAQVQKLVQEIREKADVKINLPAPAPAPAAEGAPTPGTVPSRPAAGGNTPGSEKRP